MISPMLAAERVLVAGYLLDDRRDGAIGDLGQVGAHVGDHIGGQEDTVTRCAAWGS